MRRSFFPLLLLFGLGFLVACQNAPSNTETTLALAEQKTSTIGDTSMASFREFYKRFHQDSLYQIEHIIFPLEGLPDNADSINFVKNDFRWKLENWKMHRPFDFEFSDFKRQLEPISDQLVVERIVHQTGQMGMMRRFSRLGDDWYLIYYAGMNRIKGAAPQ